MTWKRPKSGMWAGLVFGLALVVVVLLSPLPVLAPAILSGANPPVNVTSPIHPSASSGATTPLASPSAPAFSDLLKDSAALASEYGILPPALQAEAQQIYSLGESGQSSEAQALLGPASGGSWQGDLFFIGGAAFVIGCTVAIAFTLGIACVAGAVAFGLAIVVVLVYAWLTGKTPVNPAFADGLVEMRTIAGATDNAILSMDASIASFLSAVNLTEGALEEEAANAALAQLGSSVFNPAVDLNDSGILFEFSHLVQGWDTELGQIVLSAFTTEEAVYGPSGFYGSRSVVCPAESEIGLISTPTSGSGSYSSVVGAINLTSGSAGPGLCFGSGVAFGTQGGTLLSGMEISGNARNTSAATNATYYFGSGSNLTVEAVKTTGYTGLGVILQSEDTRKNYEIAATLGNSTGITPPYGLVPVGVYQVVQVYACKQVGTPNCVTPFVAGTNPTGISGDVLSATNIMLANVTLLGNDQWSTFNLLVPYSGTQGPNVVVACGSDTLNSNTSGGDYSYLRFGIGVNPVAFTTCPTAIGNAPTDLGTLENVSVKFAQAYWSFLRGQGYTSESAVPPQCVFPPISNIFSPNESPQVLSSLTPAQVQALYLSYLRQLAATYGYGLNATPSTFCGAKVPTPSSLGYGLPEVAVGNIFVPPKGTQSFPSPARWNITNVSLLVSPNSGTVFIPVNQTWEASKVNPLAIFYGSINLRVASTFGSVSNFTNVGSVNVTLANAPNTSFTPTGYLNHFTGNSSSVAGSVYPTNTSGAAGGAIFLTGCFVENVTTDTWSAPASCPFTVRTLSWVLPQATCLILGNCAPSPPPVPSGVSCPGDSLWLFGQIVDGIAGVFTVIPLIGGTLGCVIGWIVVVLIWVAIVYIIYRVVLAVVRSRRGSD